MSVAVSGRVTKVEPIQTMKLSVMARLWARNCEREPTRPAWFVSMCVFKPALLRDFWLFAGDFDEWVCGASNWRGGEASMLLCLLACLLEDEGR